MKKLLYTLLAVSIIFSACEKEEASNNSSNNSISVTDQNIVGVWDINSLVYDDIDWTTIVGFQGASFVINSDNTFIQIDIYLNEQNTEEGYWDLNGSELSLYDDDGDEIIWSINSFNGTTAYLTLVEHPDATTGSATIVKQ